MEEYNIVFKHIVFRVKKDIYWVSQELLLIVIQLYIILCNSPQKKYVKNILYMQLGFQHQRNLYILVVLEVVFVLLCLDQLVKTSKLFSQRCNTQILCFRPHKANHVHIFSLFFMLRTMTCKLCCILMGCIW